MRSSILSLALFLALPLWVGAATIRVPADQPTIQAGINVAISGDTVRVAPGTYTGADNKELDLKGKAIVLRSEGGAGVTIIDCEQQGRGFYFQAGEGSGSVVEGFTVTGGFVSGSFPGSWGGAMLVVGSAPTVRNCRLYDNNAQNGPGGGIACYDSSPTLIDCTIEQNFTPSSGGGVYCALSSPSLFGCQIIGNSAATGGGLDASSNSSPQLDECLFLGNTSSNGGALSCDGTSSPIVTRCDFTNNSASSGGGVSCNGNSGLQLVDCSFSGNSAPSGGGLACSGGSSFSISRSTFVGNSAQDGGAMFLNSSWPSVTDCTLMNNTADRGGGMYFLCCPSPSAQIIRCLFVTNSAAQYGGGIVSSFGASPMFLNCTFYGNSAPQGGSALIENGSSITMDRAIVSFGPVGEAITCQNGGVATLQCCDLYANLGGNWTGCIASQLGQNGNFSANPIFCSATNQDFAIRATSPCAPGNSPPGCGLIGALPVGCGVADVESEEAPSADLRLTVIPNPVRATARFELRSMTEGATLNIFDSQGRLVEQLSGKGGHWEWAPRSAPAGVYFAVPEAAVSAESVKFLYLR